MFRSSPSQQFPMDSGTTLPVFELDGPHTMAYPFVQIAPDSRSIRQPEIGLPLQHIESQLTYHFLETATARATSQLPDPLLEHGHGESLVNERLLLFIRATYQRLRPRLGMGGVHRRRFGFGASAARTATHVCSPPHSRVQVKSTFTGATESPANTGIACVNPSASAGIAHCRKAT